MPASGASLFAGHVPLLIHGFQQPWKCSNIYSTCPKSLLGCLKWIESTNSQNLMDLLQLNELLAKEISSFAICLERGRAPAWLGLECHYTHWTKAVTQPDAAASGTNRWRRQPWCWPGHFSHSRSDLIISPSRLLRVSLDEDTLPCARHVTAEREKAEPAWLWLIIVHLSLGSWYSSMNGTKCGIKSQIINCEPGITYLRSISFIF